MFSWCWILPCVCMFISVFVVLVVQLYSSMSLFFVVNRNRLVTSCVPNHLGQLAAVVLRLERKVRKRGWTIQRITRSSWFLRPDPVPLASSDITVRLPGGSDDGANLVWHTVRLTGWFDVGANLVWHNRPSTRWVWCWGQPGLTYRPSTRLVWC